MPVEPVRRVLVASNAHDRRRRVSLAPVLELEPDRLARRRAAHVPAHLQRRAGGGGRRRRGRRRHRRLHAPRGAGGHHLQRSGSLRRPRDAHERRPVRRRHRHHHLGRPRGRVVGGGPGMGRRPRPRRRRRGLGGDGGQLAGALRVAGGVRVADDRPGRGLRRLVGRRPSRCAGHPGRHRRRGHHRGGHPRRHRPAGGHHPGAGRCLSGSDRRRRRRARAVRVRRRPRGRDPRTGRRRRHRLRAGGHRRGAGRRAARRRRGPRAPHGRRRHRDLRRGRRHRAQRPRPVHRPTVRLPARGRVRGGPHTVTIAFLGPDGASITAESVRFEAA